MNRHTRVQAVLLHDNRILMLKQFNYKRNEEYWMLPGGGLEEQEDHLSAIKRELEEECNLLIDSLKLIDTRCGNGLDVYKQYTTFVKQYKEEPKISTGVETESHRKIIGYEWIDLINEETWSELLYNKQIYPSLNQIRSILVSSKLI